MTVFFLFSIASNPLWFPLQLPCLLQQSLTQICMYTFGCFVRLYQTLTDPPVSSIDGLVKSLTNGRCSKTFTYESKCELDVHAGWSSTPYPWLCSSEVASTLQRGLCLRSHMLAGSLCLSPSGSFLVGGSGGSLLPPLGEAVLARADAGVEA